MGGRESGVGPGTGHKWLLKDAGRQGPGPCGHHHQRTVVHREDRMAWTRLVRRGWIWKGDPAQDLAEGMSGRGEARGLLRRLQGAGLGGQKALTCVVSRPVVGTGLQVRRWGAGARGQNHTAAKEGGRLMDRELTEPPPPKAPGPTDHLAPPSSPLAPAWRLRCCLPHCHHPTRVCSLSGSAWTQCYGTCYPLGHTGPPAHAAQAPGPGPGSGHSLPWSSAWLTQATHPTPQLSHPSSTQ